MTQAGRDRADGPRKRARRARGAVAVEFALVLPILAMLLLGLVTTGLSYSHALGLTNAVREGARFGATADASLSPSTWATDVITRVRATQFDDFSDSTSVCVQLFKQGTGPLTTPAQDCHVASGVPLGQPPSVTSAPAVPSGLTSGQCVVRVIAAREYKINFVVAPPVTRIMTRSSVARYEGASC